MVASTALSEIPPVVDRRLFARLMGVGVSTFDRMRAEGNLPEPIHYGPRLIRWPRAVVESFLATGVITPTTRINGVSGPVEVRGVRTPA